MRCAAGEGGCSCLDDNGRQGGEEVRGKFQKRQTPYSRYSKMLCHSLLRNLTQFLPFPWLFYKFIRVKFIRVHNYGANFFTLYYIYIITR